MTLLDEPINLTLPRSAVMSMLKLSSELQDRMHVLLEKNAAGTLPPTESAELDALVRVAQVGQILSMSIDRASR